MREICTSGSTRGEESQRYLSLPLLLYRFGAATRPSAPNRDREGAAGVGAGPYVRNSTFSLLNTCTAAKKAIPA
jgi:hypothetical protein